MKNEFLEKQEYYIEKIWFKHRGEVHRGTGVLTWSPESGFHLIAKVIEGSKPQKVEARSIEIVKPIRMMFEISPMLGTTHAMTPPLNIRDSDLYFRDSIVINFRQIAFFDTLNHELSKKQIKWYGSAIFETSEKLIFPDSIWNEKKIGGIPIAQSSSRTGLNYQGENKEQITGEIVDNKYLKFDWGLPKEIWNKESSWRFIEALQDAISIVSGCVVRTRYYETYRGHRKVRGYNLNGETSSLGLIFRLFDYDFVPKELVGKLAIFLSEKREEEHIIRKIYWQVVDASNQNSDAGQALLLSTILEASLRTLHKLPFVPGRSSAQDPFKLSESIKRFQSEYLTGISEKKWNEKIFEIVEAYKRLRHRYAHPDWVRSQGGMSSDTEIEQSINDCYFIKPFLRLYDFGISRF